MSNNLFTALVFMALFVILFIVPDRARDFLFGDFFRYLKKYWRANSQVGGYVHDTAMAVWLPLTNIKATVGTWAMAVASSVWSLDHSTADNTSVIHIPIKLPQNSVAFKGAMLNSIDIWYFCGTADADDITPVIQKLTFPANAGAIPSVAAVTFTYDAGHNTAALRYAHGTTLHKMTLTITTPFFVDDDDQVYVELTWNSSSTSVDKIYGVRANYTARL